VSEGSHFCGALSSKNSRSQISFCASQFTMNPFSTGRRNAISPKSLHLSSSEPTNVFRWRSRAMQLAMMRGSLSDAKPAFMVYAPLSITSVLDGGAGPDGRAFLPPAMPPELPVAKQLKG